MFSGFVNKDLGQGTILILLFLTSLIILPELSDLLSGHVVCRPEENVEMDPNLFDNLKKVEKNEGEEASEKPPKKPTRRRSQKSKKEQETAPAAPSTVQDSMTEVTDKTVEATDVLGQVGNTGVAQQLTTIIEKLTDNNSLMEISSDGGTQEPIEMEPEIFSDGPSMAVPRGPEDSSDGASMGIPTEPEDSSDGASMRSIRDIVGSDEEDLMAPGTSILKLL